MQVSLIVERRTCGHAVVYTTLGSRVETFVSYCCWPGREANKYDVCGSNNNLELETKPLCCTGNRHATVLWDMGALAR